MKRLFQSFVLCFGLVLAQFFYQVMKSAPDYPAAFERSYFLAIGAIVVGLFLSVDNIKINWKE